MPNAVEVQSRVGVSWPAAIAILSSSVLLFAALIFVPAGRLDWPAGWLCLAVMTIGFSGVTAHVAVRTPSLIRRRVKPGSGTPVWDLALVPLFQLAFVAVLVVGGLDAGRHRWAVAPPALQWLGLTALIAAMFGLAWAMGSNPHFEATVRIQSDQHHRVIDRGPYRIVRHPGYAAAIPLLFGMALTLGSLWALVPALIGVVGLIVRTALEDRFLRERLAGYSAYARRTRYRLVPGIW